MRKTTGVSLAVGMALLTAACGSSAKTSSASAPTSISAGSSSPTTMAPSSTMYSSGSSTSSPATSSSAPTIGVEADSMYGNILESNGKTLYAFSTDTSTTSSCTGKCAVAWPPLETTGTPKLGAGVSASLVGHIMRPSGKMQVTYNGHPLYWFIKDIKASAPNTTLGEDVSAFGGVWYVVSASTGNPVTTAMSGSTSSTTAGSSY